MWLCAAALGCVAALAASCLDDEFPIGGAPPPPPGCGDGTCELGAEDCDSCPADCSCCSVISSAASDNVHNEAAIIGAPDSSSATLSGFSSIILVIGREIFNRQSTEPDFTLVGQVTSTSDAQSIDCASASSGSGAFEVSVSPDGTDYGFVGLWTQQTAEFDIGCAKFDAARFIRIQGQPGAEGTLDAVTSSSCLDNLQQ